MGIIAMKTLWLNDNMAVLIISPRASIKEACVVSEMSTII